MWWGFGVLGSDVAFGVGGELEVDLADGRRQDRGARAVPQFQKLRKVLDGNISHRGSSRYIPRSTSPYMLQRHRMLAVRSV